MDKFNFWNNYEIDTYSYLVSYIEGEQEIFLKTINPSRVQPYSEYASATFKKDKRINIRISTKDLEAFQLRALEEGLPYQTLIASVLHKYVNGRLVDRM